MQRAALISGGTGFVGSAITQRFLDDGYHVYVLGRTPPNKKTAYEFIACDITDETQVHVALERIEQLYVCVHAAADKPERTKLSLLSSGSLRAQFAVDVLGGFNVLKAAAEKMEEGCIIGLLSSALHESGAMGAYVPAKMALRGILREFAKELAPRGIRVNAIAPGYMQGGLNSDLPERVADFAKEKSPLKILASPQDVAAAAAFLASDEARTITGVLLPVAAGEMTTL